MTIITYSLNLVFTSIASFSEIYLILILLKLSLIFNECLYTCMSGELNKCNITETGRNWGGSTPSQHLIFTVFQ